MKKYGVAFDGAKLAKSLTCIIMVWQKLTHNRPLKNEVEPFLLSDVQQAPLPIILKNESENAVAEVLNRKVFRFVLQ